MRQSTSNFSPVLGMWQMLNKCELLQLYLIKLKMTSHPRNKNISWPWNRSQFFGKGSKMNKEEIIGKLCVFFPSKKSSL